MRLALRPHPDSLCSAAAHVDVDVAQPRAGALLLSYRLTGIIGDLRIPPLEPAARTDGLWRHTCFEAFVCPAPGEAYYEFNFAPSSRWAAYAFDGYRRGMRAADEIGAPKIEATSTSEHYTLRAALDLAATIKAPLRLGFAAVIEDMSGRLSYWALAHPAGKPDFHRADCFTCEI